MSFRGSLLSALVAMLVGCTSTNGANKSHDGGTSGPPPGTGGNGSTDAGVGRDGSTSDPGGGGGAGGGETGTPGGGGGSSGGGGGSSSGGGGGSSGSGGSSGGNGLSKCGGPLDSVAPTATSIVADGPQKVTSYSTGLPTSTLYKSLTVFYPSAGNGPFVVVMVSPGLTEILLYLQPWAQRFASYGYVAVFVEANSTDTDTEGMREDGMWAAIASIKGENTRTGSPLFGKLSDCIVTSGHSLGGGASISIANDHPLDVKGALGFNPYDPITNFTSIVAPTLILTGQDDPTAPPAQHGLRQYNSMSASIEKEYVEIAGGNHQAALTPGTIPGQYAVSWIKFTVDGDTRYRPFLDQVASGISAFQTTLP